MKNIRGLDFYTSNTKFIICKFSSGISSDCSVNFVTTRICLSSKVVWSKQRNFKQQVREINVFWL